MCFFLWVANARSSLRADNAHFSIRASCEAAIFSDFMVDSRSWIKDGAS